MDSRRQSTESRFDGRVGVVSGLIAGVFMMLWAMIVSAASGLGFWLPPKLVAGTFLGVNVIIYGAGTVVFGLFLQLVMAAVWGGVFVALVRSDSLALNVSAGFLYGATVWAFMRYLVLPWLDPTMSARVAVTWWSFFVAHLIYGVLLGLLVASLKRTSPIYQVQSPPSTTAPTMGA